MNLGRPQKPLKAPPTPKAKSEAVSATETPPPAPQPPPAATAEAQRPSRKVVAAIPARIPPHSQEAEQGTLSCILLDPQQCLPRCVELFGEAGEAFYDLRHQEIFKAAVKLQDDGCPVDTSTLYQSLKDAGTLEMVGGLTYIASLPDYAPSAANLSYYTEAVHQKHLLRQMLVACADAQSRIYDANGSDVEGLLDAIERDVMAVRMARANGATRATIKDLVGQSLAWIEELLERRGALGGLSTGLPDLDRMIDGIHTQEMTVIAGFPSSGKTALAGQIADHIAVELGIPVGIFSLEMTGKQLVTRAICSRARVNLRKVASGISEGEFQSLATAAGRTVKANLHIDDLSDLTVGQFRAKARRMVQEHKVKVIVLDYLQLLTGGTGVKNENRAQEVAAISHGVKAAAKELDVAIIALSQLTDSPKGPRLRDSADIGQDADNVFVLEADGDEDGENPLVVPTLLHIKKQRNGPAPVTVHLTFIKEFTRFEQAARVSREDLPKNDKYKPYAD